MKKRIFGFDLGVASIGWAVVDFDKEAFDEKTGEVVEGKIIGSGVRCFPVAENPKDGSSLALPRREKRLARRTCRRKARRMQAIKHLFITNNLITDLQALNELYAKQPGGDVWDLRIKGLSEKLSTEELIRVLTHLAKHRGFKSYRKAAEEKDKESGQILQAIQANKALLSENKTLAQIITERAGQNGKKRNSTKKDAKGKDVAIYNNSIPRDEIERELDLIFENQKPYGIFTEDLYTNFKKIAFRFRPIAGIGNMVGFCTFEKGEKRAPKEAPSSELFVALTKINTMSINDNGKIRFPKQEEREKIIELLKKTKTIRYKTLSSKIFPVGTSFRDIDYNKTEKISKDGTVKKVDPEDTIFYEMKGWHKLKSCFTSEEWDIVQQDIHLLDKIVNVIACEKNDAAIYAALENLNVPKEFIPKFLQCTFDKFINLSFKALYKIIPFMSGEKVCNVNDSEKTKNPSDREKPQNSYDDACSAAGYKFKEKIDRIIDVPGVFLPPIPQNKQTTVPVVNRTVAQFRKVYNAMVKKYGFPDQINIETGRELKKTPEERAYIKNQYEQNQEERKCVINKLKENQIQESSTNILKYRLYEEQHGKCMYSGKEIDLNRLSEIGYLDIDHIIPYSRSLDNSNNNKVLCLSDENRKKGNKTPFEYIKDPKSWRDFEARVNLLHNKQKENRLLNKNFKDRELEFRERNANDNSYIARYVKQYCEEGIDFSKSPCKDIKNRVQIRTGYLTDYLRHQWRLEKDRNKDDRHHAQDAIVIACATQRMVTYLSSISAIFENKYEVQKQTGEAWYKALKKRFEEPWIGFKEEVLTSLNNIFVSRPPRKKATGSAHKETIYSPKKGKGSLPIRGGFAEKENMFRLDVFKKEGHFYIVPIYTSDLVLKNKFEDAPQPYILQKIDGKETHAVIDESYQFMFSLYKDDYISLNYEGGSISGYLNQYNTQRGQLYIGSMDNGDIYQLNTSTFTLGDKILLQNGEKGIVQRFDETRKKMLVLCDKETIELDGEAKKDKKGKISENIKTAQKFIKLSNEKKVALCVIQDFKKYQIDPLGQCTEVKKERRAPVFSIKSNKQKIEDRNKRLSKE